jgi:hypothetical protein
MERKIIIKWCCPILLLVFSFSTLFSQDKIEKEYEIDNDKVPRIAVDWVNKVFPGSKMKWYYEETSGLKSFEAKLEWNDFKHSIEFDTTGILEDVEIDIEWEDIPKDTWEIISQTLHEEDDDFKIRKIQKQLSGSPDLVVKYVQGEINVSIIRRYEIEYYSTSNDKFNLWEGLFSDNGEIIRKRKVQLLTTDNLDF